MLARREVSPPAGSLLRVANYERDIKRYRGVKSLRGGTLAIQKDNPNTLWYRHKEGYGFCGIQLGPDWARLKGIYVFPEWRGFGHGTAMTKALIDIAERLPNVECVEAFTVKADWYIVRGFNVVSRNARNVRVRREVTDR